MSSLVHSFRFVCRVTGELVGFTIGRVSIGLLLWTRPGIEWGSWGYDCIWRTWAVYPLFCVDVFDKSLGD